MRDPLAGTLWSAPATVEGFVRSPPDATLLAYAAAERRRAPDRRALDVGCGAARNALPLAQAGWHVIGTDLSSRCWTRPPRESWPPGSRITSS